MDEARSGDRDDTGFLAPVVGDGRPLLLATAGALAFAGGPALFLAAAPASSCPRRRRPGHPTTCAW